MLQLVMVRDR